MKQKRIYFTVILFGIFVSKLSADSQVNLANLVNIVNIVNPVTYLFSHGFGDTGCQARKYMREYANRRGKIKTNNFYIMDGEVKTFNYPDAVCKPLSNIFQTSLGQENELFVLQDAYNDLRNKPNDIVLVGVSRGASSAATFMGACDCKKIKAVVLISPFAHVYDVFKTNFFYRLFIKFSRYSETGKHPIDWIVKMNKNIPVLFVCSKTDKTVPCSSTIRLYKQLVDCGHNKVYLLCLDIGRHARFLKSPEAEKFQNVTHAFYKKHGLPHNEKFAALGEPLLEACVGVKSREIIDLDNNFVVGQQDGLEGILDAKAEHVKNVFITLYASFGKYFDKFLPKK